MPDLKDLRIESFGDQKFLTATVEVGTRRYELKIGTTISADAKFTQRGEEVIAPGISEPMKARSLLADPGHGNYLKAAFVEIEEGLLVKVQELDHKDRVINTTTTVITQSL